jgi:hypothetical protein
MAPRAIVPRRQGEQPERAVLGLPAPHQRRPALALLDNQLFDGMPLEPQPTVTPREAVYFRMELIQFMEDVYFELNFQHRGDRENPVYAGQWRQRVPKSLHSRLVTRAEQEGVGLNTLVTAMIAEGLGKRKAARGGSSRRTPVRE